MRALSFCFMNKPIAVVSDSYLKAENFLRENFNIKKSDRGAGYYEDDKGQTYIVITEAERAMGYEFSNYYITPSFLYTRDIEYLTTFVKTRIR